MEPIQISEITFGAALWIFDTHYSNATVSRVLNQLLPAPTVNAGKAEVNWIWRQGATTLESPPLRRLAGKISKIRSVPADLNFGCTVHHDFNCAFPSIRTDAIHRSRPS